VSVAEPIIKETPELRVISKCEKGTYEGTIGKSIGELIGQTRQSQVKITSF